MSDSIKTKTINNVLIQENGIIRNSKGYLIGRTTEIEFDSKHLDHDVITIEQAMNRLRKAMKDEPAYAYSWHSNIAMACYDAMHYENKQSLSETDHEYRHRVGNESASRFMSICFAAKTSLDMLAKLSSTKGAESL